MDPNHAGRHGKFWRINYQAMIDPHLRRDVVKFGWWVHAPRWHPIFKNYIMILIDLRSYPVDEPARIYVMNATHEIQLYSVVPAFDRETYLKNGRTQKINVDGEMVEYQPFLDPVNFIAQICASEEQAKERVEESLRQVCDGQLNPDSDGRSQWIHRYGDDVLRKGGALTTTRIVH